MDRNCYWYSKSKVLPCSAGNLWYIINSSKEFSEAHPHCKSIVKNEWGSIGDEDVLSYNNDSVRRRRILQFEANEFLELLVTDEANGQAAFVSYLITEISPAKVELNIRITTDAYNKIPRIMWRLYKRRLDKRYNSYLTDLLDGLELTVKA